MTQSEAIEIVRQKAGELNIPWSDEAVVATRWRVWPFPGIWRVVWQVQRDGLTVKMGVNERTRRAWPIRAIWAAATPARIQPRLVLSFGLKFVACGIIVWALVHYGAHWPNWGAILISIPTAYAAVMVLETLRDR